MNCPIGYGRSPMCRDCLYYSHVLKDCDYERMKEADIQKMRDKEAGVQHSASFYKAQKSNELIRKEEEESDLSIPELNKKWGIK